MVFAWLTLTLSMALCFFYFQATCQKILRRQFAREYFESIAGVIRLEFPSLQRALEESGGGGDYSRIPRMLKCDFLALTYLLKNAPGASHGHSFEERLLMVYFRWQLASLAGRRFLRAGEKEAILRLTSVLRYFANVVGQRMNTVGLRNLGLTIS